MRGKDDFQCRVLRELREAAAPGREILSGLRDPGTEMSLFVRGRKVGEYTIASCIGKGRYGVCFLAHDSTGKEVVLKRFRPRMLRKNRHQNHYEAVILSGMSHPAVPELLGVINCRQGYYYVLEFKEGASLEEWLFKRKKVFSPEEIYRIGSQLFGVLEYLHSRNVVHGDISVSNLTYDGEKLSLLDFGLARYADGRNIRFSLDYARTANVLIYLLYSGYSGRGDRPWHEELPLSEGQRGFLRRMLEKEEAFRDTEEAAEAFQKYFSPQGGNENKRRIEG